MVHFGSLAAFVALPLALAHPGENVEAIKREMRMRNMQHATATRSLSQCQNAPHAIALREAAAARRADQVRELRMKRGLGNKPLSHQKRDLAELETWATYSHNETSLGYQLDTPQDTIFGSNNTCSLVPETTIGPYYVTGEFIRQEITEGQAGVPMRIEMQFVDMNTCGPVANVAADVWHCNATGVYSGIDTSLGEGGLNSTFMRGVQFTNDEGVAQFDTIFPGHYDSRTTHFHLVTQKNVTVFDNGTYADGTTLHVGQLYFDDALIQAVEATAPYNTNTVAFTSLETDGWELEEATSTYDPFVEYVQLSDDLEDGLLAWITIALDMTSDHSANRTAAAYYYEEGGVSNPTPNPGLPPSNPNAPVPSGAGDSSAAEA